MYIRMLYLLFSSIYSFKGNNKKNEKNGCDSLTNDPKKTNIGFWGPIPIFSSWKIYFFNCNRLENLFWKKNRYHSWWVVPTSFFDVEYSISFSIIPASTQQRFKGGWEGLWGSLKGLRGDLEPGGPQKKMGGLSWKLGRPPKELKRSQRQLGPQN